MLSRSVYVPRPSYKKLTCLVGETHESERRECNKKAGVPGPEGSESLAVRWDEEEEWEEKRR